MKNTTERPIEYNTLREIRHRKEAVLAEIRKDNKQMGKLWNGLFHNRSPRKKGFTWSSMLNTGVGFVDGAMLVWKLYRKFKR